MKLLNNKASDVVSDLGFILTHAFPKRMTPSYAEQPRSRLVMQPNVGQVNNLGK